MLAPMAAEDITYLTGKGIVPSPAQIVRLNDLALRATRGAESAGFIHAPRVAWADRETPFFEPGIGAEKWIQQFASVWWCGNSLVWATAFASAHSNINGFFDERTNEKRVRREIETWQKTLSILTEVQVFSALDYALNGLPQDPLKGLAKIPDGCPYTDMIVECVAAGLGVTIAELNAMPYRIATDCLQRWTRNQIAMAGGKPGAINIRANNAAWVAYDDFLNSIEHPEGVE